MLTEQQELAGYQKFGELWHDMGTEQKLAAIGGQTASGGPAAAPGQGGDQWFHGATANEGYVHPGTSGGIGASGPIYNNFSGNPDVTAQILAAYPNATQATPDQLKLLNTPDPEDWEEKLFKLGLGAFASAGIGGFLPGQTQSLFGSLMNTAGGAVTPTTTGFSGTFNPALPGSGGALPYGDAIEGLIDLTNKGMSGADAVAALGEINPAWTQTGIEFLMNNPSQLFGSGSSGLSGALKGLLGGSGGTSGETDWLGMLGKLGAAGLGAYASGQQSDALNSLASKYQEYGAPSRARFEAAMSPGFDPTSIPGYSGALDTASKGLLARLSTQGNPYGSPGGLIEANKQIVAGTALPAISEYTRQNANVGFGGSMNAAANLQTGAIDQDANKYNALGYGLSQVTQPQTSFDSLIKSLRQSGLA